MPKSLCESLRTPLGPPPRPTRGAHSGIPVLRQSLDDLHEARQFRAMKSSFVLTLEAFSANPVPMVPGVPVVLLDVEGEGSLRHI